MFKASDAEYKIPEQNHSFVVNQYVEVNTVDGWKYASAVCVDDKLIVDDEGIQCEIIVSRIERLVDKNQIIYYY